MYLDSVVLAGVGTVALMLALMVGMGYAFVKEAQKRSKEVEDKKQ